jgi:tRNA A-37 threonylcarbamoyl transferase component Bud32
MPHQVSVTKKLVKREETQPYKSPSAGIVKRNMGMHSLLFTLFGKIEYRESGKGLFGETFLLKLTDDSKNHFKKYIKRRIHANQILKGQNKKGTAKVYDSFNKIDTKNTKNKVLVKIMTFIQDSDRSKLGMQAVFREINAHSALSRARPIDVTTSDGTIKTYDIRKVIPRVHGWVFDRDLGFGCIVMDYLDDAVTLDTYVKNSKKSDNKMVSDKNVYAAPENHWILNAFEEAFTSLWLHGYFHSDVHTNNVMIDVQKKRVYIIDFGLAIKLTKKMKNSLVECLKYPQGLYKWWAKAQAYGNQAVYSRYKNSGGADPTPDQASQKIHGLMWQPNGNFLKYLRQSKSSKKRKRST